MNFINFEIAIFVETCFHKVRYDFILRDCFLLFYSFTVFYFHFYTFYVFVSFVFNEVLYFRNRDFCRYTFVTLFALLLFVLDFILGLCIIHICYISIYI